MKTLHHSSPFVFIVIRDCRQQLTLLVFWQGIMSLSEMVTFLRCTVQYTVGWEFWLVPADVEGAL